MHLADKLNRCVPCNENGEDFDDIEDDRNHLEIENRELKSKNLKQDYELKDKDEIIDAKNTEIDQLQKVKQQVLEKDNDLQCMKKELQEAKTETALAESYAR